MFIATESILWLRSDGDELKIEAKIGMPYLVDEDTETWAWKALMGVIQISWVTDHFRLYPLLSDSSRRGLVICLRTMLSLCTRVTGMTVSLGIGRRMPLCLG